MSTQSGKRPSQSTLMYGLGVLAQAYNPWEGGDRSVKALHRCTGNWKLARTINSLNKKGLLDLLTRTITQSHFSGYIQGSRFWMLQNEEVRQVMISRRKVSSRKSVEKTALWGQTIPGMTL